MRTDENINLQAIYNTAEKNDSIYVYEIGKQNCMPDKPSRTHVFENTTIHFVISGEGYLDSQLIGAGEGFMISENETAIYRVNPDNPWTYYWINFSGSMVSQLFDYVGLAGTKMIFKIKHLEKIVSIFEKAFANDYQNNDKNLLFVSYLFELLSIFGIENSRYKLERGQGKTKEHFNKALKFISENYCNKISVADIAYNEGVERHYLDRVFKMYSDLSPQQHLLRFRMSKSSILLRSTDLSITEIATRVGYDDVLHFSKTFKAYFNESPTYFRSKFIDKNK
jgi:AraC-like DNA-binding protein